MNDTEKEIVNILTNNYPDLGIAIRVLLRFLTPEQQEDFLKNIK